MKISKALSDSLFDLAEKSFRTLVAVQENKVVLEQLGCEDFCAKREHVRFTCRHGDDFVKIEAKLTISCNNKGKVGYYCLHFDENSEPIDDFLVWD